MKRATAVAFVVLLTLPLAAARPGEPVPPEGFRAIFNGKDLTGWYGLNPHSGAKLTGEQREANLQQQRDAFANHWRVENGELVNDGTGPYATTDEAFGDIELLIEYKTVPKADSGVYLRGTPQVQIWDWNQVFDPNKPDRKPHLGSGGLFNNAPDAPGRDPLVLADKPFGEWNSFRIRQIGDRTTVWLNDKLVVDNAVMENYWDRSKPLPAKGPIMLQTHGGEIRWRNLFVRDISAKPAAVRIEKDVTYLEPDREEKADLYLPAIFEPGKKYPGIVIIHGGGWTGGDKGAGREINIGTTLASNGYVCMSINYALAKAGSPTFPQNIQECKRAVRWLRKNADRFQLDADHIGAIGGSAGGHLTALLAVSGPDVGLDPEEDAEYSCRVQAAVPMYPHCAASWEGRVPPQPYPNLPMFAKPQAEAPALWDSASPIKQLSKDDPPMLILHGTADKTTPLAQSTRFHEAALAAGVPSELIIIEDAPHSFHLQPKQRDLRPEVIGFFDKHLKPNE
ncbi:MAG: family 16 glycoside hydrolase [Patescibacteria group bacterium]|nr:family 16 glycoside hydrolase [Patescibacteria group bacterium]